jgi:WD40 repeat protein
VSLSFPGEICAVAFSPNGRFLAAANVAGTVKVWEVPTFREAKELQAHAYPVSALAFSQDSRRLASTGDGEEMIKLWDVDTWQELMTLQYPGSGIVELRFMADGIGIVARNWGGDFLFWRAPSFAEIEAKTRKGPNQ